MTITPTDAAPGTAVRSEPATVRLSFEEQLLDRLDGWMQRHPGVASLLATLSLIALGVVLALAVVGSSNY